ncbi:CP-type G domain-containing protein [Pleurotus pulmonarius]
MPRIRKKTSNRSTTNDRKKITQKVRETKKKKAKAAKKNPQWKSKHKKDPGIPNNFPYKDQILAEVAEQRRQAEEEKQKRKEEKRAAKVVQEVDSDADDGIASLAARHLFKATAAEKQSEPEHEDAESDEDETPLLFSPDLPDLKSVLECADVVVSLLDARDPLPCRSSFLENWISDKPEKRILFLLNKIDSCPREAISAWLSTLRGDNPTLPFRSSSAFLPSEPSVNPKIKGKVVPKQTADAIGRDAVLSCLQQWGKEGHLTVAVVGPTNTGKSSFINSLLGKSTFPTCTSPLLSDARPSTTTQALEATLQVGSSSIRIIDTPGFLWKQNESTKSESIRARDILLRSKGRIDRLKDPIPVVSQIVERSTPEDLMLLYNLPAFSRGNSSSFLSGLARAQQLVMKHGKLDLTGASRIVLRDWSTGKFPRYTLPATAAKETSSRASELANLYATELDVLALLPTHKEMRKGRGVIKMSPGEVDSREVQIDAPWLQDDQSDSEQDEDIGGEMAEEDAVDTEDPPLNSDSGSNEEEDEEEDEEELPAPAPPSKRKRSGASSTQPNKRVSFAAGTATKEPESSRIKTSKSKSSPKGLPKRHGKAKKV